MKKTVACIAGVLVSATALAGCSSSSSSEAGTPPSSTTTQAATTGEARPANPGTGIIGATKMTSCDTAPGKVTAKGTVTPPEGTKGTVKITVSWVDPTTSAVLARGEQTFEDAAAGEALDWVANAEVTRPATALKCVLGATVL
ncbi:hypothetical protein LN996_13160 [Arthrobacter sp. AK01]|uniref:hypothetical protein n=1 Tax=Micrococcaceae TaxID=1268 RepID=UPI001E64F594|nr:MULTISPECIES: hypothetical protein [Micrococcaceae]MCD4851764.1 hypothetical protein [Arthrobacter sp. AK01]MCP1411939.1 ABC-type glycerol-3-phosphate transport system substrate-binding protein [Paenarthrobacter sp. A20]